MKERPTWASFRHIPNNEEGAEFMRLFNKYRNRKVIGSYKRRGRKPTDGKQTQSIPLHRAGEFSLYLEGASNAREDITWLKKDIEFWRKDSIHWNISFNNLYKMTIFQFICFKFNQWRKS